MAENQKRADVMLILSGRLWLVIAPRHFRDCMVPPDERGNIVPALWRSFFLIEFIICYSYRRRKKSITSGRDSKSMASPARKVPKEKLTKRRGGADPGNHLESERREERERERARERERERERNGTERNGTERNGSKRNGANKRWEGWGREVR